MERLKRVIETWVSEHDETREYQIDVLIVHLVPDEKYAEVDFIENIT